VYRKVIGDYRRHLYGTSVSGKVLPESIHLMHHKVLSNQPYVFDDATTHINCANRFSYNYSPVRVY
jgi:hypothetical protein